MKKILSTAIITAFAVLAFAASVVAATNPFIDVPSGHWAYDDLEWLIAEGVISGYPDGTFKGRQPATRYEMASIIARTLPLVDLDKADVQEMNALKRLFAEFSDELDALGVKLDELDPRLAVLNERLNGWRFSGVLIMDVDSWQHEERGRDAYFNFRRGRLYFNRWFGENEDIFFQGSFERTTDTFNVQSFYVEFPTWFGTYMTVGLFSWDWESPYYFRTGGISDLGNLSYITDRDYDAIGIRKSFLLGTFRMFVHKPNIDIVRGASAKVWEAAAIAELQLTERLGLDIGFQYMWGDDGSVAIEYAGFDEHKYTFDSLFTYFGGLQFEFNDYIGFRGIYYGQKFKGEYQLNSDPPDKLDNSPHAYKLALDISQDLLGFTSLWLGYDFIGKDFWTFNGDGEFEINPVRDLHWAHDTRIWRIGAIQQWNNSWRSWAYFAHHTIIDPVDNGGNKIGNVNGTQWGIGVEYRYNSYVAFALNYVHSNFDNVVNADNTIPGDNHLLRFRTQVSF